MMTGEENLALGPETRLQALRVVAKVSLKRKKGLKASDIDIRRGQRAPHSLVWVGLFILFNWLLRIG